MSWKLSIPKILHIFWSGSRLPYLRYMTVVSFMKLNPNWKVMFWYSMRPYSVITWRTQELNYPVNWKDYTPELMDMPITKTEVDFNDFGMSNDISEVHKSDFLRYYFLSKYGGVYSDMDILYFRPITNLKVNKKENKDIETFVCISSYGHSNGFFMAKPGSKFFEMIFGLAHNFDGTKYQSVGPDLCNDNFPTLEKINEISPAMNIGMDSVYYYSGQQIGSIYSERELTFPKESIGIHWFAGHPFSGKFLRETRGGTENYPNNILGNICKIIL